MLNHLEKEPKRWDEFYGFKEDFNIHRAKIWLQKDCLPTFLYLEGASGTGKTIFAKTLIRSFNCLQREDDEVEPCGTCSSCSSDPSETGTNNNVYWVKSSFNAGATQQSTIKEALQFAEQGPVLKPNSKRSEILFLVFEEAQNISKDLLQRVLAFGDVKNSITSKLCFIFITMSPEDMNTTVNKALRQRGSTCKFKRPSQEQLEDFLLTKYPDTPKESAKLIASEAENSYRGLINTYLDAQSVDETLDPAIISRLFECLKKEDRVKLWRDLQNNITYNNLKKQLTDLFYFVSPIKLIRQMQEDLDLKMSEGACSEQDYLDITRLFTEYLLNQNILNPINLLTQIKNRKLGF